MGLWRVPNDLIREPFAAMRFVLDGRDRSLAVGGMMLTSAPVSTRKWAPDMESLMWRRIDLGWLGLAVKRLFTAISLDRVGSFPNPILVSGLGVVVQSTGMATCNSKP